MKTQALWSLVALLGCLPYAGASPVPPAHFPDLVEKVLPGVVNISSVTVVKYQAYGMDEFFDFWGIPQERRDTQTSLGTGFVIDQDGFVLTNNHVVEQADEVLVTMWDKRTLRARLIGKDQKTDIALIQLRDDQKKIPKDLTPVQLGNSDAVRIAESVFAVGNPMGFQHTVTMGIISAKNRTIGQGPFDNFLQTDASINPGNSGGPLFNTQGEVIGINTAIISGTRQNIGLGFAIPINEAKDVLADLKRYGRVPRPWLGVLGERMNPQIQAHFALASSKGVLVYRIVEKGPSDRAGMQPGDIITSVGGSPVNDLYEVERALFKFKPKQKLTLEVLRGRKKMSIDVSLTELPSLERLPRGIL